MTVNINLLQKQKPLVNPTFIVILLVILLLLLASIFVGAYKIKRSIQSIEEELAYIQVEILEQTEMSNEREQSQSLEELINATTWLEQERVNITGFLSELTALLPTRGYILSLQLSNKNQVEMIVQFDTQREAAYLLHSIKQADWSKDASLATINEQQAFEMERSRFEASYSFTFDSSYFSIVEEEKR